jgi:adenosylhomocysteine nucleosidase
MGRAYDSGDTLILVAIEDELPRGFLPDWNVVYMGVGKFNATYHGMEAIREFAPKTVVNYGSAGSVRDDLTGIHEVSVFKQRDMDVRVIDVPLGKTPFDPISTIDNGRGGLSVGTGDSFVTQAPELETDLVDMEAYVLAKICKLQGIEFHCYKFISDKADGQAAGDWKANLAKGAGLFSDIL